jgi:ferric-dicitrate binding protein FerR (iron transport regulator)
VLNGEASSLEEEELHILLQQDESLQQQYDLLVRIWKEKHDDINEEDNINASSIISRIMSRATNESIDADMVPRRKRRRRRLVTYLALSSFAVITAAILFYQQKKDNSRLTAQAKPEAIVTQKGSRSQTLLADGTTVWLNGDSRLHYENDFSGSTREVTLEGEAFFDVVKQADRPFIVHTSGIDIKVLGTAFNVKSYPEDKNVETTLYRGSVEVFRHDAPSKRLVKLVPNQTIKIPKQAANEVPELSQNKQQSVKENSAEPIINQIDSTEKESERIETAWVYDRLKFEAVSFEDVAKKLERWFNVTINFTDENVKKLNVYGSFKDESVEAVFAALKVAFHIDYKINNHEIFVGSSQ